MAIWVSKSKLTAYLAAAGLTEADQALVSYVPDLMQLVNSATYNGIIRDANDAAIAAALSLPVSDYYKVRSLAVAAGYLVQV